MKLPNVTTLAWNLRSVLPISVRKHARRVCDHIFEPLGSINGAVSQSSIVALTFDDGPDSYVTPRLLDLLRLRSVHATFFLLTDKVTLHPDIVHRMVAEGHEIALHADRHERFTLMSLREVRRRLLDARDALQGVSGRPVRFFRPPFGAQSIASYLIARTCELDVVVWGPYAEDWAEGSPESVAIRGLKDLEAGDVLLLHDGLEIPEGAPIPTFDRIRAFELILDGLDARGLSPSTVSELISSGKARRTVWFRP